MIIIAIDLYFCNWRNEYKICVLLWFLCSTLLHPNPHLHVFGNLCESLSCGHSSPKGSQQIVMFWGLHVKITDSQTFPQQLKAQPGEWVFTLNKQAGRTLTMHVQRIGRKWGGEGEEPSHVKDGSRELCSETTSRRRQALLRVQPGG